MASVFKNLVARADTAFSEYVRFRDSQRRDTGGMCFFCLIRPIECVAHIFHRAKFGTRWDPEAARGSCFTCNGLMEVYPNAYVHKFAMDAGHNAYEDLLTKSQQIMKFSRENLTEIIKDLRIRKKNLAASASRDWSVLGASRNRPLQGRSDCATDVKQ